MIDLYYWPTPNGWKVTIMLEECGLDYKVIPVDIGGGDQFKPGFLKISPNNRMPAIVDHAPPGGGEPVAVFESGAILEYLADKSGLFLSSKPRERFAVLQWVHWQIANLGPMMGNAYHFKNYAETMADDPGQLKYGVDRFTNEVDRLCGVMDAQLAAHAFLAGSEYSIADMASWPWAKLMDRLVGEAVWDDFPNLKRWVDNVASREQVERGWQVLQEVRERKLSDAEQEARRKILFNQTNEEVRQTRLAAALEID